MLHLQPRHSVLHLRKARKMHRQDPLKGLQSLQASRAQSRLCPNC